MEVPQLLQERMETQKQSSQTAGGMQLPMEAGSIQRPQVSQFDKRSQLLSEYGAMQPCKEVYCYPDSKVTKFLR